MALGVQTAKPRTWHYDLPAQPLAKRETFQARDSLASTPSRDGSHPAQTVGCLLQLHCGSRIFRLAGKTVSGGTIAIPRFTAIAPAFTVDSYVRGRIFRQKDGGW